MNNKSIVMVKSNTYSLFILPIPFLPKILILFQNTTIISYYDSVLPAKVQNKIELPTRCQPQAAEYIGSVFHPVVLKLIAVTPSGITMPVIPVIANNIASSH
jgi:hypothetical protein